MLNFYENFANQALNFKFIKYNCDITIYFKLKTYSKTCNMFKKKMIKVNQNIKTQITKTFLRSKKLAFLKYCELIMKQLN